MNKFGIKIKELRMAEGLSKTQLAKKLCINAATVSSWERGINNVSIRYVIKAARYFKVTTNYLLGVDD